MLVASQHDPQAIRCHAGPHRINCQNDFEGGSVPVPKASEILPNIKKLRQHKFDLVITVKSGDRATIARSTATTRGQL